METMTIPAVVADTVSGMVDAVVDLERMISGIRGVQAQLLDQARRASGLSSIGTSREAAGGQGMELRSLRAELAAALRIPERTAEAQLAVSESLVHDLPATLVALVAGEISYRHAQILVDNTAALDSETRAALETMALPSARNLTAAKFERKIRALRERANPETIRERHVRAVSDREVVFAPARDGMAWLNAYLPAADALGAFTRLSELATNLQGPGEPRTLTQLRADVFRDLLIDGQTRDNARCGDGQCGGTAHGVVAHGVAAKVFVTVPVLTLLGRDDLPATLDGYGPIDADTARALAGHAPSFIRLLTHPETGAVLSVGRDSYRVPQDLKNWLQVRDATCRFPGCSRHAARCEIDHTRDWAHDGQTRHDNLAHLCKSHHTLKHKSDWQVTQARDGTGNLTWTSPAGRDYTTEPEIRIRA
jgi:cell division septum initiation protein DivIVA